jgi:ADP-ribosylglycohydrolase
VETLRAIYQNSSLHSAELETHILPDRRPSGTGYVVDAIRSARHACNAPDYAAVIQSAIAFGNDTDTTACIAGGIAGIRHGKSGIPTAWIDSFRGTEILLPLLERIRLLG